jgi:hypothetical protein
VTQIPLTGFDRFDYAAWCALRISAGRFAISPFRAFDCNVGCIRKGRRKQRPTLVSSEWRRTRLHDPLDLRMRLSGCRPSAKRKSLSPLISGTRRVRIGLVLGLANRGRWQVGQQSSWVVRAA